MDKQILDELTQSLKSNYDPYYIGFMMHPEEGRDFKINEELSKIKDDLVQIDNALITAGEHVYNLMTNTILRLNNVHANIMTEKERYQDMQMLCNKYNDYDNVKLLDFNDFEGSFTYKDGVFSPQLNKQQNIKLHIIDVFGNGYEGNKYVYKDYMYTQDTLDTSVRENIIDGKNTSYYEYSRITVNNDEDATLRDFNKDNKEAQCTITFQAEEGINEIEITSDEKSVIITNVSYSLDGKEYIDMNIPYISINNKLDSYENTGYIYGSGKIAFPCRVQLFKVTFQSTGYTNDELAYQKALTLEGWQLTPQTSSGSGVIGQFELESIYDTEVVTEILKSGKRHVIKINEVAGYLHNYSPKSRMQSFELINQDVYAIALFANVYIPQGLQDDAVKFIFTINGHDFPVVPINSHMNGIKTIRFSTSNGYSPYTERIGEKIKSAYLSIIFSNETRLSPHINNIKILLGGEL